MTQTSQQPSSQHPGASAQRPGQMTATMRAVTQATGPKVLRIGLVQGGKVIEERVIKQRTHVLVGPSEKSTFVLPTKSLPPTFKLFELVGNEYCLNFLEGMTGRVALKTGISDLAALRGQARRVQQGSSQAYQIILSEEARGKVVIGETTFLFQFVAPPPIQPRPQLPVAVRAGMQIDWNTTIIAAFSFLFHFGFMGSIYSEWGDEVVNDDMTVQQLLETVRSLPPPPPEEEQKKEEVVADATTATATTAAAQDKPQPKTAAGAAGGAQKGPGAPSKSPGRAGQMSDADKAALSSDLDQFNVDMLGAIGSTGVSTDNVMSQGDVPMGRLNDAGQSSSGSGFGKVTFGGGGGNVGRPGEGGGGGLGGLGDKGQGQGSPSAAAVSAKAVKGPTGNVGVGGAAVSGGSVSNASSVVAGMAAGFRRCYNKGLQEDPNMKGSVKITAKIGPNGEVVGVSQSGSSGLSGTVTSCVAARVSSAQFAPPDGGGATIVIPVSFYPQ